MNRPLSSHRLLVMLASFFALVFAASIAAAQSAGQIESELSSLSGQMSSAESNESTADQVVARLDAAESSFAKLTSSGKVDKGSLIPVYRQLEGMLERMQTAWLKKKDDCINTIDNGGQCDYDKPEQLALRAAYPLAWLRFTAATTLFDDNAEQSKKLLNQAIEGFTNSMLAMPDPNLIRENTLGRAFCERELGKFEKPEYDHAIADFKKIMDDGTGTQQYAAARQGLSTTYAKMGDAAKAAELMQGQAVSGKGAGGQFLLQLQTLFSAERATSDPVKKAAYHKQIIDLMKTKENDKEGWAMDVSAASKYPSNAVEEFGNSSDPFEKWLLAAVLLSRKDEPGAAKYYSEACDTGKYPKACRFAAEIYQREKRYDLVEAMLTKIAAGGGGEATQAVFLKYSLVHNRWEQSGQKDAALESQWVKDAQEYLQKDPNGEHAAELQVALAERLQRQGDLAGAAEMYSKVKGAPEFTFTARFKAAECYYKQLVGAGEAAKSNKGTKVDTEQLRKLAVSDLNESIKMGPEAERTANSAAAKKAVREIRGEATYMLASILQEDPEHIDYAQVAPLLVGYESNYPMMSAKFQDVIDWRITALDHLGRYDEVNTDVAALVERSKGDTAKQDFIKGLGIEFWKTAQAAKDNNDQKTYLANAKLTATAYKGFADMAASGKIPVKNLTGTLSIYAQALQATGHDDEAEKVFEEVVKADPASPDANAGLARRAEAKSDWKDANERWTAVENTAAESDPLWYEAKFHLAVIYSKQGNVQAACSKLAQTRAEHPTLGSPEMKVRWDKEQRSLCLDHKSN
jgi:tetratricopeptide repeat protein